MDLRSPVFEVKTIEEIYLKLRKDRNIAKRIRTIGRVKSLLSRNHILTLQSITKKEYAIQVKLRTPNGSQNYPQGSIVRALLTSSGRNKSPRLAVNSLRRIKSLQLEQYLRILKKERMINRFLSIQEEG